jgi:rRNA maturation endonuclease Nob1
VKLETYAVVKTTEVQRVVKPDGSIKVYDVFALVNPEGETVQTSTNKLMLQGKAKKMNTPLNLASLFREDQPDAAVAVVVEDQVIPPFDKKSFQVFNWEEVKEQFDVPVPLAITEAETQPAVDTAQEIVVHAFEQHTTLAADEGELTLDQLKAEIEELRANKTLKSIRKTVQYLNETTDLKIGEIAKMLGIRYQQAYNALKGDPSTKKYLAFCKECGRGLTDDVSVQHCMGPVCEGLGRNSKPKAKSKGG